MDLSWTCPSCRVRNATIIGVDVEAGKIVVVDCPGCGAQHQASVIFSRSRAGSVSAVGVVWI